MISSAGELPAYVRAVRTWADADDLTPAQVMAALGGSLVERLGVDPPSELALLAAGPTVGVPPPPDGVTGVDLGRVYEGLLARETRRRGGVFFTPPEVAGALVEFTAGPVLPAAVCDPAVGAGAFLLAAAHHLESFGLERRAIVEEHLWGSDVDHLAVAVAEFVLWSWSADAGPPARPGPHLVCADVIADRPRFVDAPAGGFDLVVGNPPFQGQLSSATARSVDQTARLRRRFGVDLGGYVDAAALFLLAGAELVRPGGRVGLIVPESVLVARDASGVRDELLRRGDLDGLWVAAERVFPAAVDVCAPVVLVGRQDRRPVRRSFGPSLLAVDDGEPPEPGRSWSALLSRGAPDVGSMRTDGTLADTCQATAGFRDQYYALTDAVREEDDDGAASSSGGTLRLVTSGLIDPGVCFWGTRPTRFARTRWHRPVVDLALLEAESPRVAAWARARAVPKVVVATQTRILEAAVDSDGAWYPSVPTIAVTPSPDRLWHVAAVLLAPPITSWAFEHWGGAALARDALKLSARQVLEVPVPADRERWDRGAELVRAVAAAPGADERHAARLAVGRAMSEAYGLGDDGLLRWWEDRLPRR